MFQTAESSTVADGSGGVATLERRGHERVRVPLEVRWEGLSGWRAARIYDISMSGCYVEALSHTHVAERLHIEIQTPAGPWLELDGEVIHHQPYMGFGLRFVNLTDSQRDSLAALIEYARTVRPF
jgi:hypothetical protein